MGDDGDLKQSHIAARFGYLGLRVEGLRFGLQGLGLRVWGSGSRVEGLGFGV